MGETRIGELTDTEKLDLMKKNPRIDSSGLVSTPEKLGITLKEGQDLSSPDFKFDANQLKDFYRNSDVIENVVLSPDEKTAAAGSALAAKQLKVDLKVDAVNHGARNQAIGVAAVPTLAVGAGGYWGYNKWCSTKDDKPVDQKPADQKPVDQKPAGQKPAGQKPVDQKPADQKPASKKPVDNRRQNTDPNARTNKTAGDRNNTKTDGSKTQVEGGDDTKTNKTEKKSGIPGWAIVLIIFAIVAVIGAVVYFVFFTSKDEDEEFDNEL